MTAHAGVDVMVAVHQDFRLDHGHDAAGLADRGIAGQRMGVGVNGVVGWNALADIDHGAPFGEFGAKLGIFLNAGGEAIEAFGHGFAG